MDLEGKGTGVFVHHQSTTALQWADYLKRFVARRWIVDRVDVGVPGKGRDVYFGRGGWESRQILGWWMGMGPEAGMACVVWRARRERVEQVSPNRCWLTKAVYSQTVYSVISHTTSPSWRGAHGLVTPVSITYGRAQMITFNIMLALSGVVFWKPDVLAVLPGHLWY